MMTTAAPTNLYQVVTDKGERRARFSLHGGQTKAFRSRARFPFIIAGTQSGKTVFGPLWLKHEIDRCGPGDYLVVSPTYPLLQKKVLPEFLKLFLRLAPRGEYKKAEKIYKMDDGTQVFFGHASDPDALESATAKAAWLDECGQDKFSLSSWEAIQRRLSIHQGRALGTTTPYNLGWLKTEIYDRWRAGDPDYRVIQFKSIENPAFPRGEYERARRTLPGWKFEMFYNGQFTRPAGMIYDNFEDHHKIDPFAIPDHWRIYGGMDFGGVNTAAVRIAENPETRMLYLTDEYHTGSRTAEGHARALDSWRAAVWYGGAKSEGQWRREFTAAGLPMNEPSVSDVEVGIDRVYGQFGTNGLYIFNTAAKVLDEIGRYSREVDDTGEPTEKIKDKNDYHLLDALRYVISTIRDDGNWLLM